MLSDTEKLNQIIKVINAFQLPDEGTYEDMYLSLEMEVRMMIRRLRNTVAGIDLSKAFEEE